MTTKIKGRLLIEENNVPLLGNLKREFVTSTAVTKGSFVALDNGTGTISDIDGIGGGVFALGTPAQVQSVGSTAQDAEINVSSGKLVSVYEPTGTSEVKAKVGTLTGETLSWGAEQTIDAVDIITNQLFLVDLPNETNKMLVMYEDPAVSSDGALIARVLTIDPILNTISAGARATIHTAAASAIIGITSAVFDTTNNKVVVFYTSAALAANGSARVGTVSGTTSSWGAETDFTTEEAGIVGAAFDSVAGKVLVCYRAQGGTPIGEGVARVGTVSGTTISFGTEAQFEGAGAVTTIRVAYDVNANKTVVVYQDSAASSDLSSRVATISGTTVSFGTEAAVTSGDPATATDLVYSTALKKVVLGFRDSTPGDGEIIQGTVAGTDVTWADRNQFISNSPGTALGTINVLDLASRDPEAEVVIVYGDTVDTEIESVHAHLAQGTITTAGNWIGVAQADGSIGASVEVALPGSVDCNQSGMTPNVAQFLADNGTLQTVDNSRPAGLAISATELLLSTVRAG